MATYKLIQDVEAEDHILGPLTFRQFVFMLVAVFCSYMCFLGITRHLIFLVVPFAPVGLFFGFFAIPFGRDQPTEIWFLAKLRFWFKPRRRIWDQSGVKELVTITAPKKIERVLTNGLNQNEVRSRLSALANTLDSRGWAVKGIAVNAYSNPDPIMAITSDRLIDINNIPQEVPNFEVHAGDDIFEESTNPVAQQFSQMIAQSEQKHRQQLINQMNSPRPQPAAPPPGSNAPQYWFTSQGGDPVEAAVVNPQQSAPVDSSLSREEEQRLAEELKARHDSTPAPYGHLRTLRPLGNTPIMQTPPPPPAPIQPPEPPSPPAPDPAILSLASNNDLNVATLAREAHKAKHDDKPSHDEVVISLR